MLIPAPYPGAGQGQDGTGIWHPSRHARTCREAGSECDVESDRVEGRCEGLEGIRGSRVKRALRDQFMSVSRERRHAKRKMQRTRPFILEDDWIRVVGLMGFA